MNPTTMSTVNGNTRPSPGKGRAKDVAARLHTYAQWIAIAILAMQCPQLTAKACGILSVPFVCSAHAATPAVFPEVIQADPASYETEDNGVTEI